MCAVKATSKADGDQAASQEQQPAEGKGDAKQQSAAESKAASVVVAAAADWARPLPPLQARTELTLHLVGAERMEVFDRMAYEELLHSWPALQRLRVVFVGPDAPDIPK